MDVRNDRKFCKCSSFAGAAGAVGAVVAAEAVGAAEAAGAVPTRPISFVFFFVVWVNFGKRFTYTVFVFVLSIGKV